MPPAFHCTLCGISTASAKNYWAHVQGRAHARRAVKAGEQLPPSYSPMISAHVAPPLAPMPTVAPSHPHGPHPPPHPAMFRHMGFMPGMQGGSGGPMQAAMGPALDGSGGMHPMHPQPLWPGGPPPPPQLPAHHPVAARPPSFHLAPHLPPAPAALPEEGGRAAHRRFRCDTCAIYTTSAELLESHLGGRKHLRRLVSLAEQRGETLAPSLLQAARWYTLFPHRETWQYQQSSSKVRAQGPQSPAPPPPPPPPSPPFPPILLIIAHFALCLTTAGHLRYGGRWMGAMVHIFFESDVARAQKHLLCWLPWAASLAACFGRHLSAQGRPKARTCWSSSVPGRQPCFPGSDENCTLIAVAPRQYHSEVLSAIPDN